MKLLLLSFLILLTSLTHAQVTDVFGNKVPSKKNNSTQNIPSDYNRKDAHGLKQGKWVKYYSSGKTQYEVTFKNDKPIGEMVRFYPSGKTMAKINYQENGLGKADLYSSEGKLQAKGDYWGQKKHGEWQYFSSEGKVNSTEQYNKGVKDGVSIYYYANGNRSEEIEWKNNIKDGIWNEYYESGAIRSKAIYKNGNLDGDYWTYHENGKTDVQGQFVEGVEDGTWMVFSANGYFLYKIEYDKGKVLNQDSMDEKQMKMFKEFEENKGKLKDPENFKENPDEYIRGY